MRLELSNPSIFKDAFDCIGTIIDECKLEFDPEGLTINALDKSHITFLSLYFRKTLFDEYECETPESIIIDTNQLMKILKRCKTNDILKLDKNDFRLILTFDGDATRQFHMNIIDSEYEAPSLPRIDYNVNITVPTNLIKESLSDTILFSDNLGFIIDSDYLRIDTDGEFGETHTRYIHGESIPETVESHFSINMLQDIFKASKLSKECTLWLGNNIPIQIEFKLPADDGYLRFLLAPRLNQEDE